MSALSRRARSAAPIILLTALIPVAASFSACAG
jgi:hypothetical protein